jgi:hypothetical protein
MQASLIKMACRSDGALLQPGAPARAIDVSFALSGAPEQHARDNHPVMATSTAVGGAAWTDVLTIGLNSSFALQLHHLNDDAPGPGAPPPSTFRRQACAQLQPLRCQLSPPM